MPPPAAGTSGPKVRERIDTEGPSPAIAPMIDAVKAKIVGQPRAVEAVAESLETDYADLLAPGELAMQALFVGPPGVGKTQLAYEFAKAWIGQLPPDARGRIAQPVTLIDGTQYVDSHDIANLRGSTKGYVGYHDRTPLAQANIDRYAIEILMEDEIDRFLAEKQRRYPTTKNVRLTRAERERIFETGVMPEAPFKKVILFDEIGRAHRSLWNILITILNGKPFEFGDGSTADFSRAALLMSDNTNEKEIREIMRGGIGFRGGDWREADPDKLNDMLYKQTLRRVEKVFPPALVSRILKHIVGFRPLGDADWGRILDLRLTEITELFVDVTGTAAPIRPVFTDDCKALLLEKGVDRLCGARPLAQVLQKQVTRRLAKAINSGAVRPGQRLIFERERKPKDRIEVYVEK